jgi:tripartite-type tricarboxylate transporter receptor subunit TctC
VLLSMAASTLAVGVADRHCDDPHDLVLAERYAREALALDRRSGHAHCALGTVAMARKQPGQLSYASYGAGSQPQLATEMLKQKAGVFIVHIPYRGIPQAVSAVVSGEIALTWAGIPSARPHLQSKRIKALAYGGKTRHPAFPDVPTVSELGYAEVDANVWVGLFAPIATPPAALQRMERDVAAILRDPGFKEREIDGKGYDLVGGNGQELARHIRQELQTRAGPIRYSGSRVE